MEFKIVQRIRLTSSEWQPAGRIFVVLNFKGCSPHCSPPPKEAVCTLAQCKNYNKTKDGCLACADAINKTEKTKPC
jgi:hypothetical protein